MRMDALEIVRDMLVKPCGSWFLVYKVTVSHHFTESEVKSQVISNIYFIPLFTTAKLYVGC